MARVEIDRVHGEFGFEATDENGITTRMDGSPEIGGKDFGARPMHLLVNALAGCASIDVLMILKRQRQDVRDFKIVVNAEKEDTGHFSLWKQIEMNFYASGNIEKGKMQRAVELSMAKYCSVAETLRRAGAEIVTKIIVNESDNEL